MCTCARVNVLVSVHMYVYIDVSMFMFMSVSLSVSACVGCRLSVGCRCQESPYNEPWVTINAQETNASTPI